MHVQMLAEYLPGKNVYLEQIIVIIPTTFFVYIDCHDLGSTCNFKICDIDKI